VYRRAYALLLGNALLMGGLAIIAAIAVGKSLADPEGSFLGPSWLRLPLLLTGALLLDMLPRIIWFSKGRPSAIRQIVRDRLRTHWTRERLTLVALGIASFYVVYVSYRNLKSFLPDIIDAEYDRELHLLDRALMFGHDPSDILHALLGTGVTAWFLSYIYLWFLPLVPLAVTAWVVWSRNLSYGYWFVTSQCIAWTLGTASYYALPTLGPGFEYASKYHDLPQTPTADLMSNLQSDRATVLWFDVDGSMQTVAGFASLHCAITLLIALMIQFTLQSKILKIVFWCNFGVTVVATLYFGWHYIADDIAGVMIAFIAFYIGGIATGQKFERRSLQSHPTTTTAAIPVDKD
jgi:hypothetical protein